MAKKGQSNGKALAKCRECEHWDAISKKVRVDDLIKNAVKQFETKMAGYEPSITEYVKLLQLEQEIAEDEPKEIKVTWVNPEAKLESEK